MGKRLDEARKQGKTAIVGQKDLSYGMGRMYESLTEIENFATLNRSFRSIEQARYERVIRSWRLSVF